MRKRLPELGLGMKNVTYNGVMIRDVWMMLPCVSASAYVVFVSRDNDGTTRVSLIAKRPTPMVTATLHVEETHDVLVVVGLIIANDDPVSFWDVLEKSADPGERRIVSAWTAEACYRNTMKNKGRAA